MRRAGPLAAALALVVVASSLPRALAYALTLTTFIYLLPLAACAAADKDWPSWGEGQFELLGLGTQPRASLAAAA